MMVILIKMMKRFCLNKKGVVECGVLFVGWVYNYVESFVRNINIGV